MEVEMVHTTGSPGRHDSDSDPMYCDRKRLTKSSSEMALHRKQTRRCKKQMSERQRRKRMNNSMEKLGLLVYGKTFQDGLKVDKATLLKDAYERLQTLKDDYHKGYETAIASTQTFLDSLHCCPPEVKAALSTHLNNTLQLNLQRCHSAAARFPSSAAVESGSDSCSPPPRSSLEGGEREGEGVSERNVKEWRALSAAQASRKIFTSPAVDSASQQPSHKLYNSPAADSSTRLSGHKLCNSPSANSSTRLSGHKLYDSPSANSSTRLSGHKLYDSPAADSSTHFSGHRVYSSPVPQSPSQPASQPTSQPASRHHYDGVPWLC